MLGLIFNIILLPFKLIMLALTLGLNLVLFGVIGLGLYIVINFLYTFYTMM